MLTCTAGSLKAILCFTDPENTPKIAYDNDSLALPLIQKIKDAVGERDGSQNVHLSFSDEEDELLRQFNCICESISGIFGSLAYCTKKH